MSQTKAAKIILKVLKGVGITIVTITMLTLILAFGTYACNAVSLKKEAALIEHKGQYVEVDGHNMNLFIEGSGDKTIVIMSGAGVPSPVLEYKPLADRLSGKYRVVIIEKFGYGYSDEIDGDRTVSVFTEQDREALKKAGIEAPYILCPHSASGFEAMWWANKYPDEVEAIIGLDMSVPEQYDYIVTDWDSLTPEDPEQTAADNDFYDFWMYKVGLMRYMNAREIFPAVASDELTEAEQKEYKALMYTKYAMWPGSTMSHEQWFTQRYINEMRELHDSPVPDVSILMFVSEDEQMAQLTGSVENWQLIHENYISSVTNGRLIKLECGHYVHIEEPDRVSEGIAAFVDAL